MERSGGRSRLQSGGDLSFLYQASDVITNEQSRYLASKHLARAAIESFCDICAVFSASDAGEITVDVVASREPSVGPAAVPPLMLALTSADTFLQSAIRSRAPAYYDKDSKAATLLRAVAGRSLIVAPLLAGRAPHGALLFVESTRPSAYDASEVEVATVVARQFGAALENAQLRERDRQITERAEFLARTTDYVLSTLNTPVMLQGLTDVIVDGFADWAVVSSLADGLLRTVASAKADGIDLDFEDVTRTRLFTSVAEAQLIAALTQRRPLIVNEVAKSPAAVRGHALAPPEPQAWMMAPLLVAGSVYGAITCYSRRRTYADVDLALLQELCRRVAVALEHSESFARERRLTQTLQQATLPSNLAKVEGAALSAFYVPADREERVGGDWYDAYPLGEHRALLTIGDVTGHGLSASVIMGKLRHAINIVSMYEQDPARILDVAEEIVLQRFPDAIATAFVAIIDTKQRIITYANAGHPHPMFRYSDGSVHVVKARGLPIGVRHMAASEPSVTKAIDADLLALYTDGLTEASRDVEEGEYRLKRTLGYAAVTAVKNPAEFIKACSAPGQVQDDVAVLTLNFVPMHRWTFASYDQRAAKEARLAIVDRLADSRFIQTSQIAELIFGELMANAARYAPGQVDVALDVRRERAILHLIDRGSGYVRPDFQVDALAESGRGLWIIDALGGDLTTTLIPDFGCHAMVTLPALHGPSVQGGPKVDRPESRVIRSG